MDHNTVMLAARVVWNAQHKHWVLIVTHNPEGPGRATVLTTKVRTTAELDRLGAHQVMMAVQEEMEGWLF